MRAASPTFLLARVSALAALVVGLLALVAACRAGRPVLDPTGPNPHAPGTISGTVRGAESSMPIEGRLVEVVNIETGERQRTRTSNVGGFTFKVSPGRYRVSVALNPGESLLKQPGIMDVNKSDVDAFADFIIGISRIVRPRIAAPPNPALGPPIV